MEPDLPTLDDLRNLATSCRGQDPDSLLMDTASSRRLAAMTFRSSDTLVVLATTSRVSGG